MASLSNIFTQVATTLFRQKLSLQHPPANFDWRGAAAYSRDCVRYATLALALRRLETEAIPGVFAEAGVFQGETSRFLKTFAPSRKLYLFDTFQGFPEKDLDRIDKRFGNTSLQQVKSKIGDLSNVEFRVGYFPETAIGLEDQRFAFVMLDMDLFNPTKAGLEFFYPRMSPGGYIFLHDYNNIESDFAVSRAADAFMSDKSETIFDVPDMWGTVAFRKSRR